MARFLEFFAGRIANARTRAAYGRAVGQFLGWCEARGLRLGDVSPLHVAAYIRTHPGSVPTVKQHLAAIRMLGDWLVVNQVLPVNPGRRGARPEARCHQGRDTGPVSGGSPEAPRDDRHRHPGRAPGPGAPVGDALQLRAGERGPGDAAAGPLTGRALQRRVVLAMIKRRAAAAGLPPSTCCHTFRATGITAYLSNGGTLEHAQQIAGHASPKTTKLYDRTADTVTVDEIERIVI